MWKEQCIAQKKIIKMYESEIKVQDQSINKIQMEYILISLTINLVVNCCVSFRSVPKILTLIKGLFEKMGFYFKFKIPHFTTVINRTLRMGKHLLKKF